MKIRGYPLRQVSSQASRIMDSITNILIYGIVVTGIIYASAIAVVIVALGRISPGMNTGTGHVTVVIAARNERRTLGSCLAALARQDYPRACFSVIVADDRSSDGTGAVAERFKALFSDLSIIRIDSVPAEVSPKKNALARAISHAKGDIILQTDADCLPPPSWISGMVRSFGEGVGMVAGIAPYLPERGMLNSFVRHEYVWNAALSAAGIALGHGTHASGRNLGFRRSVFEEIGGYGEKENVLSGDDTLLLQRLQRLSTKRVVTASSASTHVFTQAPSTPGALLLQRIRHMSTGKYFNPVLIALGTAVYGFHLLMLIAFVHLLLLGGAPAFCLTVFLWKCLLDAAVVWRAYGALHIGTDRWAFPLNEILLIVYMAFMPMCGLVFGPRWKEND